MMPEISTKLFLNSELTSLTVLYPLSCVRWCCTTIIFSSLLVFSPPFLHSGSWYTFIIFLSLSSQSLCLPTQYFKKYICLITVGLPTVFRFIFSLCKRNRHIQTEITKSQFQISGKGAYLIEDGQLSACEGFLPVLFHLQWCEPVL